MDPSSEKNAFQQQQSDNCQQQRILSFSDLPKGCPSRSSDSSSSQSSGSSSHSNKSSLQDEKEFLGSTTGLTSIVETVFMILRQNRFAARSSLPWGHRPHPCVGASCLLFLLPIPLMWPCFPFAACVFAIVTVSSVLSDHIYTGIDSWAHAFDKTVAPCTFAVALRVVYLTGGPLWASSCLFAIACHILAIMAKNKNSYERFVLWHTLWHVVGVGLIVACLWINHATKFCVTELEDDN